VDYSTVDYSTVYYSTVYYSTVYYYTVYYSTVYYSTVNYSTVYYSTVYYSTVYYSTVYYCRGIYVSSGERDSVPSNVAEREIAPSLVNGALPSSTSQTPVTHAVTTNGHKSPSQVSAYA